MKGTIMPQVKDSRQQPKSLAERLIDERVKTRNWRQLVGRSRRVYRERTCTFMTDSDGGKMVFDRFTNQALGYILPTVSDEVLRSSPGIQAWSKPDHITGKRS